MAQINPHGVIAVTGASGTELEQLKAWLKEYEIAEEQYTRAPDMKLIFSSGEAQERHITLLVDYLKKETPGADPAQKKKYSFPIQSFNEPTLRLLLNLVTRKKEEIQKNRDYQYAFQHAEDMIMVADCNYEILNANPAAIKKFAYSKEELLLMNIRAIFYDEKDCDAFIHYICNNEELITEYTLCTKAGLRFPAEIRAVTMNEEEGLFLIIARDISRQKELEAVKGKQDQLAATGKMARIIAHELRNPLYNIVLAAELSGEENGGRAEEQEIIQRNCQRIDNLIRQLLEPAQWDQLNPGLVAAREVVEQALALAEDRIQLRRIAVVTQIDDDLELSLDLEKMKTALVNLVVNAVEAIDHDRGEVAIEAGFEDNTPFFRITDNGKGMSEQEQRELFSPYFTTKTHGMGLGLVNVLQIVKAHGGILKFSSQTGKGTVFHLKFPLQDRPPA